MSSRAPSPSEVTVGTAVPLAAAGPMVPRPFRVLRKRRELTDVVTLELAPADGGPPLDYLPGQFTMLYAFGIGEVPISISGEAGSGHPLVHTIRAVGAVSGALCGLRRGDVVGVRGPYGTAWPVERAEGRDVVVVAGGIGLAPLRPAVLHLLANRRSYGRVAVLYGARHPADLLYRSQVETWRGRFDLQVKATVDHADPGWHGPVGVVTELISRTDFEPADSLAMICGPEVMMRFTAYRLLEAGMSPDRIYISMERNMKCAVGLCGHCQLGADFVCKDGPVTTWAHVAPLFGLREV